MLYCVFWSSSKKAAKYLLNNCYFPPNKKILQKEVYKQKENLHGKSIILAPFKYLLKHSFLLWS